MALALLLLPLLPFAAAAVLHWTPEERPAGARFLAVAVSLLTLVLAAALGTGVAAGPAPELSYDWALAGISASVHLGLDGVATALTVLTALIAALSAAALRPGPRLRHRLQLVLLLEACTVALFMSMDMILFYFFWELMLVPSYLLLANEGEEGRKAAFKYIFYNGAGGLLLLLGLLPLVAAQGSSDLIAFTGASSAFTAEPAPTQASLAFFLMGLGFAVKVPLFPFHGWMPPTYTASEPGVAAFLSGVQSKAGLYGFFRIALPLLPAAAAAWAPLFMGLAAAGLIWGAFAAWGQQEARGLIAYSSLSHLGLIVMALFSFQTVGWDGALLQMINHGLFAAGLFLIAGMLEIRSGAPLRFDEAGGLARRLPALSFCFGVLAMAALGLPGLNGFAGEFVMLLGLARAGTWYVIMALFAIVLAAVYMLRLYQGLMHGEGFWNGRPLTGRHAEPAIDDLRAGERWQLAPLLILIVLLGLYPAPLLALFGR